MITISITQCSKRRINPVELSKTQYALMTEAVRKYPDSVPIPGMPLEKCFTNGPISGEMYWFDDGTGSTHTVSERHLNKERIQCN